jgi:hypothetical protein
MRPVVLLCFLGLLVGCGGGSGENSEAEDRVLAAVQAGKPFDLVDVAPFAWDRVVKIDPYGDQAMLDKALGFHWDAGDAIPTEDNQSLTVFIQGKRVTGYIQDFESADVRSCLPRSLDRDEARLFVFRGSGSSSEYTGVATDDEWGHACAKRVG